METINWYEMDNGTVVSKERIVSTETKEDAVFILSLLAEVNNSKIEKTDGDVSYVRINDSKGDGFYQIDKEY